MHHFSWENDSLVVDISKHKADQTGERVTPKHIYANPFIPELCPIMALALHVFGNTSNDPDVSKLFHGNPYEVFTKWLKAALGLCKIYTFITLISNDII